MVGTGGGVACNPVVSNRNTDETVIVAASSATSTRLAQNPFGGARADQVRFAGAIGADPGVIAMASDSPCQTLLDLVNAAIADPGSVALARGSAVGGFDHMKPRMILQAAGLQDIRQIRYIGVDDGADAISQTVGGFTQAMSGDMSEVVGFLQAGQIRVLAVLTPGRVPGFEDMPTAREQGCDVVAVNWRGIYVPGGMSDKAFQTWAERLAAVAASPQWHEAMAATGLAPLTLIGAEFQNGITEVIARTEALSHQIGVIR